MAPTAAKAVTKKATRTCHNISHTLSQTNGCHTPNPTISASASRGSLDASVEQFKPLLQLPIAGFDSAIGRIFEFVLSAFVVNRHKG
jgi:hypothetical protein